MNRRSFIQSMVAAIGAAAIPFKLTLQEKKALAPGSTLTAVQARKIENKLIQAVHAAQTNPAVTETDRERVQRLCLHLKGGRHPYAKTAKGGFGDFAIGDHTFVDGTRRVNCLVCFKKWFPGQPGWEEAEYMLKHTTNTRTASEVPLPGYSEYVKKSTRQKPVQFNGRWVYAEESANKLY